GLPRSNIDFTSEAKLQSFGQKSHERRYRVIGVEQRVYEIRARHLLVGKRCTGCKVPPLDILDAGMIGIVSRRWAFQGFANETDIGLESSGRYGSRLSVRCNTVSNFFSAMLSGRQIPPPAMQPLGSR